MIEEKVLSNKDHSETGLETTSQIHYPYFSKSVPPKMQMWPPPYVKSISGSPLFSGLQRTQF